MLGNTQCTLFSELSSIFLPAIKRNSIGEWRWVVEMGGGDESEMGTMVEEDGKQTKR